MDECSNRRCRFIYIVGRIDINFIKKTAGSSETGVFFIGPDVEKIYKSTSSQEKPAICFGWDFNNFKRNENYAGASFSNLDYSAWGVADDFWGMNFNPASIYAINGFASSSNSNNGIVTKKYSCKFSTDATSGYLRTRWMITNINNNNITCHFGLQSGSDDNYSLWSLNVVALKRSN